MERWTEGMYWPADAGMECIGWLEVEIPYTEKNDGRVFAGQAGKNGVC